MPLPKHSNFPKPEALPNLTHCEGFLDAVAAMTTNRPLQAISFLRSDTLTEDILDLLQHKARHHPLLDAERLEHSGDAADLAELGVGDLAALIWLICLVDDCNP